MLCVVILKYTFCIVQNDIKYPGRSLYYTAIDYYTVEFDVQHGSTELSPEVQTALHTRSYE